MFRRRSVSILDIPLIEPEPGQEFPFGQQDGGTADPPPASQTPGQLQELHGRKKKKVVACAGIAVLWLVIVGAVILVAVKQSQSREATETDRQRYFTTIVAPTDMSEPQSLITSTSIPPPSTTLSTEEHDKFQSKLIALYKIVPKCNEKEKIGEYLEFDCELIGEATPENIDTLIKELTPKIKEARFGEDSGSLNGLKEIMDKLETTTNTHHMSYATVTVESTFH